MMGVFIAEGTKSLLQHAVSECLLLPSPMAGTRDMGMHQTSRARLSSEAAAGISVQVHTPLGRTTGSMALAVPAGVAHVPADP